MADEDPTAMLAKLHASRSGIASVLRSSADLQLALSAFDARLSRRHAALSAVSDAVAPIQPHAVAVQALRSRIDRAVSPAVALLRNFSLVYSLQQRLLRLSPSPDDPIGLVDYVDCVDRLHDAVAGVAAECEPAVQRLQEAVEFLSRTKATDRLSLHRLKEALAALQALYQGEVDEMRYDGLLDEALLLLQENYESLLLQLKHDALHESEGDDTLPEAIDRSGFPTLASPLQINALRRIAQTLAANDCLDIAIDIFVKVRYRRAAKGLMRLNPEYLRTYAPEEIDLMGWAEVEAALSLWIRHLELAVRSLFAAEKQLCYDVLGALMNGEIWQECFAKIADRIMAVFFRFGEGVARSSKQPQKLFKLLDMFGTLDRIWPNMEVIFEGDPCGDIRVRFRELHKLVIHAAAKVFWEFGLRIEGLQDGQPAANGSVPKIVRHAVHYLKYLATDVYAGPMAQALRIERTWRTDMPFGSLAAEADEGQGLLLRDAVRNILEALQRNLEAKRASYSKKDRTLAHVMATNSYWYIYMRTKGTELAKMVGEDAMKAMFKNSAEQAAFLYQDEAWGPLLTLMERDEAELRPHMARARVDEFMRGFDDNLRKHKTAYCFPDADLRQQILEAVAKVVVPAYAAFLRANAAAIPGRTFLPPDSIRSLLRQAFEAGREDEGRREMNEEGEGRNSNSKSRGGERVQRRGRGRAEFGGSFGSSRHD